jgi:chitinase
MREDTSLKKRRLLLPFVIILTFVAGFLTGIFSSMTTKTLTIQEMSLSRKQSQTKEVPKEDKKVLIGYVQDFRNPNEIDYDNLTHIIFSFAHPTKDGNVLLNGDTALGNMRAIVNEAGKTNTKVMLAVGGWYHMEGGESYPYFKEAISNPASRTKLVQELKKIVQEEQLDGIDVDFEHPRSIGDANNLAIFIKDLKSTLEKDKKELSIAVNAKVHSVAGTEINNVQYEPTMFKDVDYVNIMAYDGQWDGEYNAANLSPFEFNKNIVNYWTRLFDSHQIPREKLVLGIPSYGQPENPNIKQVSYGAIINNNPENAKRDFVSMNGTTYHYNGVKTVQNKTKLAMDNGLGGMMLWEVGLDAPDSYSLTSTIAKILGEIQFYAHN